MKTLRKQAGYTQEQIADALDVTVAFISNIENDRVKMNLRVLSYYAKLLNVSIDYLLRPESDENGEKDDVLNKEILRLLEKFSTDDKEKNLLKFFAFYANRLHISDIKKSRMTGSFFIHSFSLKSDLIKNNKRFKFMIHMITHIFANDLF